MKENAIALVTGGATGIGAEVCRQLAGAGARVAICDVNEADGAPLAESVGGEFLFCDVADVASMEGAVVGCCERLGVPDYAHLNAGVMTVGRYDAYLALEDVSAAQYRRVIGVNVDGVFNAIKALLPRMREKGGAITVTASIAGFGPLAIDPLYAATKAALISLVRSIAAANEGSNVRINAICPGVVDTAIVPDVMSGTIPMMPPSTMAAEILDLLDRGPSGEIRVKLNEETPAFHVEPNTLGR
ncbi:MAG: SDR family NAD(P)-dependent oxidoreductase [Pseudomonadales bacterium]|nr:SDR family oxidoreductase [Pseudomonadales bacterium]NIX08507.1 SDR family NAD(P)-dependent oxidoreductase [Pseudomonadales bacterium]